MYFPLAHLISPPVLTDATTDRHSKSNRLSMKVNMMESEFQAQHRIALAERQVCRLKDKPAEQSAKV
jgi:hypothetical protein